MEWQDVDKEELERLYYDEDLSDNEIARRFDITKGKVTYKRRKWDINMRQKLLRAQ